MSDEEEINYLKNSSNITNSDSMSALNDNASTYMGVKTIPEGTIPDTNKNPKKKKNKKGTKNKTKKSKKRKKKKKSNSSSSSSSSSSSFYPSSSSDSENIQIKQKNKNTKKSKEKIQEKENNKNKIDNNEYYRNNENKENIDNNKIETKFEWSEGGNMVYVTGSFCDWKKFFLMKKDNQGKYTITLSLPRGFHQYKFIIDDIWTYSKQQPKFEDNGNVNNFIDTTNYDNLNIIEEKTENNNDKNIKYNKEEKQKKEKLDEDNENTYNNNSNTNDEDMK